ncbi:MAG: DMT family transporter [Clostridia bacterium]|nr:DMT family transporter [Clostridia bacterium]
MAKLNIKNSLLLILAALIWGVAFVAQKDGAQLGSFTFNGVRSFLGGFVLIPVILLLGKKKPVEKKSDDKKGLLIGGICCGIMLFIASSLQQIGLSFSDTDAGKAGFITALYMVFVPIFSIFLGKKLNLRIVISVVVAVLGMYFLCINDSFSISKGDILILLCAIFFTGHILVIDHFVAKHDGVKLSCIQFFTCGVLSLIPMFVFEDPNFSNILSAWLPLCYTGIMSSGVAYTLQIVGQKDMNPTVASILLSLESVFAVLAGMILLGETMLPREIFGCILMFIAIILTQLPSKKEAGLNG